MVNIILGAVLAVFGIQLLEAITELTVACFELAKAHISVRIMKCNAKIAELNTEPSNTRAIGFAIAEEECEDDE